MKNKFEKHASERFGVSLGEDILGALDQLVVKTQFSQPLTGHWPPVKRTLVAEKIDENQIVAGAIVIVYDHHKRELNNKLMHVQHDFHELDPLYPTCAPEHETFAWKPLP